MRSARSPFPPFLGVMDGCSQRIGATLSSPACEVSSLFGATARLRVASIQPTVGFSAPSHVRRPLCMLGRPTFFSVVRVTLVMPPPLDAHKVIPQCSSPSLIHRLDPHLLEAFHDCTFTQGKHRCVLMDTTSQHTLFLSFFQPLTTHPPLVMQWFILPPFLYTTPYSPFSHYHH